MTGQKPPANYEIRVRGHLGATMRRAFPALGAQTQGHDTLLRGAVQDQAALHGLLQKLRDIGVTSDTYDREVSGPELQR